MPLLLALFSFSAGHVGSMCDAGALGDDAARASSLSIGHESGRSQVGWPGGGAAHPPHHFARARRILLAMMLLTQFLVRASLVCAHRVLMVAMILALL